MKSVGNIKKLKILFFVSVVAILLLLCGCSDGGSAGISFKSSPEDEYIYALNQKLVSFSDCANSLSDSLDEIAAKTTVPTNSQISDIESRASALSAVCTEIQQLSAPEKYAQAQTVLNSSMQKYTEAMAKCGELMNFYREYEQKMRTYKNPSEGGKALKQQSDEIYNAFAESMKLATSEFHTAQAEFSANS